MPIQEFPLRPRTRHAVRGSFDLHCSRMRNLVFFSAFIGCIPPLNKSASRGLVPVVTV
jgi:hypothetical protein